MVCALKVCALKVCALMVCALMVCALMVCALMVCALMVCALMVCALMVCALMVSALEVCASLANQRGGRCDEPRLPQSGTFHPYRSHAGWRGKATKINECGVVLTLFSTTPRSLTPAANTGGAGGDREALGAGWPAR